VRKRQRRLSGVDEIVVSLYAKGLTTGGDISALRRDLWGVRVEGDGRRITDRVVEEMSD
jgi:putative transposase